MGHTLGVTEDSIPGIMACQRLRPPLRPYSGFRDLPLFSVQPSRQLPFLWLSFGRRPPWSAFNFSGLSRTSSTSRRRLGRPLRPLGARPPFASE